MLKDKSCDTYYVKMQVRYEVYQSEEKLGEMVKLIEADLSEPYSIYTYRYFLQNYPDLCFLVQLELCAQFHSSRRR